MKLFHTVRRHAGYPKTARRRAGTVLPMVLVFVLGVATVAHGAVWTDQDDYTPGSVVTISGDNSNAAGYLAGETVMVDVIGPNGFTATCEAVADASGAWTCQITLWADDLAVGDYTYTATGQTSGTSERGEFSDNHQPAHTVRFATSGLPAGIVFNLSVTRANNGGGHTVQTTNHSFTSPGPSATAITTAPGTTFSYSGFTSPLTVGGQTCTLTGTNPASGFMTGFPSLSTTVTATYNCVTPNTAPTTPGVPVLSTGSNPNNTGLFGLGWTASTDVENDSITYTLQHRDADDAAFSNVATGLATNSYSFSGGGEAEGTWTYRAQASDGSLSSAFSGPSAAIVVDKSAPNAPSLTPDRAPDYAGDGGWYLDTVTVSTSGNGDPNLQDGSAGSGVNPASVAGPTTYNASGSHTTTKTVSDNAGNTSGATSLTVKVDATNPVVNISCPTGNVVQGSTATASWTASDEHSGLVSAASGSVSLNTSTIGIHTANAPAAMDNVGRSAGANCSYNVIYSWNGFFRPVDNLPILNVAKAGSAIPVKFSLNGNQGLDIFAAGYPKSIAIACPTTAMPDGIDETSTSTTSGLSYDAANDQYNYVWKTTKTWSGCRQLQVMLKDGQMYTANFQFTK